MPEQLTETATAVREATGSSIALELITPGWGSSGYYSPAVLEAAGRDRVFPAGTHMYVDHPSASEDRDRPERSVRDLAAVLTSDGTWNGSALVAEARVFGPYQDMVAEMKDAIGVSIRASGDVEIGEAEGRRGRIITSLVHSTSVDFVTHAGRGGRVAELLESARPTREHLAEARNVGQWVEAAIHRSFTVLADDMFADGRLDRDERIALSGAIGDALAAFVASLETNAPQLYQRDIWDEPTAPLVAEAHASVPGPAGGNPTHEENQMPNIEEGRLAQLEEAAGRVPTLESERDTATRRAEAAEAERDQLRLTAEARPLIAAHLAEAQQPLPTAAQARVVDAVASRRIPTNDQGIDVAALNTAVEAAAAQEAAYLRLIAPAATSAQYGAFGSAQESMQPEEFNAQEAAARRARVFGYQPVKGA